MVGLLKFGIFARKGFSLGHLPTITSGDAGQK
jgi:hypothetical protein